MLDLLYVLVLARRGDLSILACLDSLLVMASYLGLRVKLLLLYLWLFLSWLFIVNKARSAAAHKTLSKALSKKLGQLLIGHFIFIKFVNRQCAKVLTRSLYTVIEE